MPGVPFFSSRPARSLIVPGVPKQEKRASASLFCFIVLITAWWEPRLSPASYSCRKGKGTLYGVQDLQRKIRRVSKNNTIPTYVVKRDLRGYFMSLNHKKLYSRILWGLNRQCQRSFEPKNHAFIFYCFIFVEPGFFWSGSYRVTSS